MIKVLIVDDHAIVRAGLRCTILTQPDMEVAAEAGDGAAVMSAVEQFKPDVAIMDIAMPGRDGIQLTREVLSKCPTTKVIMLSGANEEDYVDQAIEAGACGYLLKSNAMGELITAIRAVMSGYCYLSPQVTAYVLAAYKSLLALKTASVESALSKRELEILKMLSEGLRTKDIAIRLDIGPKTVETYRARLMVKLKCGSTVELVRYAIRQGIASA